MTLEMIQQGLTIATEAIFWGSVAFVGLGFVSGLGVRKVAKVSGSEVEIETVTPVPVAEVAAMVEPTFDATTFEQPIAEAGIEGELPTLPEFIEDETQGGETTLIQQEQDQEAVTVIYEMVKPVDALSLLPGLTIRQMKEVAKRVKLPRYSKIKQAQLLSRLQQEVDATALSNAIQEVKSIAQTA